MLNPFIIKKWAALLIGPSITVLLFFIALTFYNLIIGLGFFLVGLLLSAVLGSMLLKTPFTNMLEGKGLLCINLDSTGVLRPFNVGLQNPFIKGKYNGQEIQDIFDRAAVMQIAPPIQAEPMKEEKDGKLTITLDQGEFINARFAMYHYPVLVWNDQLKTLLTKDDLTKIEKDSYAEHGILYLNKQVEDLNKHLLNFGRYIVENIKPAGKWFQNKYIWIVIVAGFIIVAIFLAPLLLKMFAGITEQAGGAISGVSKGALTPK